jgi:hypothetical protein
MKLPEFPKELKRDSVSVVIYKTPSKGYDTFTLAYYQDGHRRRECRTSHRKTSLDSDTARRAIPKSADKGRRQFTAPAADWSGQNY